MTKKVGMLHVVTMSIHAILLLGFYVTTTSAEFLWGAASSAYQYEGAVHTDGRGPCIWDTFSALPGKIFDGETAEFADESYERYLEDIDVLKRIGLKYYRMSLAWPRIFPSGRGELNEKGIDHYNKVFDALLEAGITPIVTLYHWDLPQALEDEYLGWLSNKIENDFVAYADTCFSHFGDRVKYWSTMNEPWTFCVLGYDAGTFAPGRCSNRTICAVGDSATEPYLCAHNVLNTHSAVVQLYRKKYQKEQKGIIGIVLNQDFAEPQNESNPADVAAAQRANEFKIGWFADPLFFGDYPESMRMGAGSRLPQFTKDQKARILGSWDVFYLNHYTTQYYTNATINGSVIGWFGDQGASSTPYDLEGNLIGPQAQSSWLYVVPWGIYEVLMWNWNRYRNATLNGKPLGSDPTLPFIITENGVDVPGESQLPLNQVLHDTFRTMYFKDYLANVKRAIADGIVVHGYFAWSLLDNFEWVNGYEMRFGLTYVNFSSFERIPKQSALWYGEFAANNLFFGMKEEESSIVWYREFYFTFLGITFIGLTIVFTRYCFLKARTEADDSSKTLKTTEYFQIDQNDAY